MSDPIQAIDTQAAPKALFEEVLGPLFETLPLEVQRTHRSKSPGRWVGKASVTRGTSILSRLIGRMFRFPQAGSDVPVEVIKTRDGMEERWERRFGATKFRSVLSKSKLGITEQFWPFTFELDLNVQDGALHYPVKGGRPGPIPLPRWALPVSRAREFASGGQFRFDVELRAPITGELLVHYRGLLREGND